MAKKANNLQAMVALDHAFGNSLTRKRQFKLGATPAIYITAFMSALSMDWRVGVVTFVVSLVGCYYFLLPRAVGAEHDQESLNQRNLLINQLSQSLVDTTKPYQMRLSSGRDSINGSVDQDAVDFNQLKSDMDVLVTKVFRRESDSAVHDAFTRFVAKYEDDDIFVLFFEQVETLARQGYMDENIISSLRNQHNELFRLMLDYISKINAQKRNFFIMSTYSLGLIALIMSSLAPAGGEAFVKLFNHGIAGAIVMTIFISAYIGLMTAMYKRYFDRSLTSFSSPKKKKEVPMTERMREKRMEAFINNKVNQRIYKTITRNELSLMQKQQLSLMDMIKFQYNRFVFMFTGSLIFGSVVVVFAGVWEGIIAMLIGAIAMYFFKGYELRGGLVEFRLKRAMAFAKFTRLVLPYLKSERNRNGYLIFETVSRRLDDEGDRLMVYRLLNDIRDDPSTDAPYVKFATDFAGDQRSITFMRAIYGVLNTNGGSDVVDSLAQQANDEFMAKVREVIDRKLGKYSAFVGGNVLVAMIAVSGIIGSFLLLALKGAGM